MFAFSLEADESAKAYLLCRSGRYVHSSAISGKRAERFGLQGLSCEKPVLRTDKGKPVDGYICILGKPA